MLKRGPLPKRGIFHLEPLKNIGFNAEKLTDVFLAVAEEKTIALAVSGGADSLALMVLVRHWLSGIEEGRTAPEIVVYSVDHQLRKEAAAECEQVKAIANAFGFEHKTLVWRGVKPENGIQEAARQARYGMMGSQMVLDGAELLLSAHHMDDQAETVLMRLARGSGLNGLGAMAAYSKVNGARIFRPLLKLRGKELALIVKKSGLNAINDPSNSQEKYERVRWRKFLRSEETELNAPVLAKFARRMNRAEVALERFTGEQYENNVRCNQFGVHTIAADYLCELPEEIAIRLLAKMIFHGSGGRQSGELAQRERLFYRLLCPGFNGEVIGGAQIALDMGKIAVFREANRITVNETIVEAGDKILWDQRLNIENRGGEPVIVTRADKLTRGRFEQMFPNAGEVKMAWVRAAPMVVDMRKSPLAIGAYSLSKTLVCDLVKYSE